MSQINSNTKDDFQVVLLLSCFVGHPVSRRFLIEKYRVSRIILTIHLKSPRRLAQEKRLKNKKKSG